MTKELTSRQSSSSNGASPETIPAHDLASLLAGLESSLRASQQALLTRDVSRLEKLTEEQAALQRAIAAWHATHPTALPSENAPANASPSDLHRLARARVLHLGRVQHGLLHRMQRRLKMLSNLTAGPQTGYSIGPACTAISVRSSLSLNPSASMEA